MSILQQARIGIVGATGYTGSELVRILKRHPFASIEILVSDGHTGEPFSKIFPAFRGIEDRTLDPLGELSKQELDLVFLAVPNGVSMNFIRDHGTERWRTIDLSGDFRLRSQEVYEAWYGSAHAHPERLGAAVYGLPELYRQQIREARLVANPGCYPTSAILSLAPLLKHRFIQPTGIIVDSKSGVTGAGATAKPSTHFPDIFGNFRAYGILRHRHTPEMEQVLSDVAQRDVQLLFTPHLLPIDRGILTTIYAQAAVRMSDSTLREMLHDFYADEPFVRMAETPPTVKNVRGSNYCDLFAAYDERTNHIVAVSAIDNLVKGAAGQAVQNMNLMFGWPETAGLEQAPLSP